MKAFQSCCIAIKVELVSRMCSCPMVERNGTSAHSLEAVKAEQLIAHN